VPDPNGSLVGKENESTPRIHRRNRHGHLGHFSLFVVPGTELEKEWVFLRRFHLCEPALDAPLQVFQKLEALGKLVGFRSLDLPVLNGRPAQSLVGFHHLVGGRSVFVLGGFRSDPDVQIVLQSIATSGGIQDNVGIALEELTVLILRPGLDLEFFDSPNAQACFLADSLPGFLALGGGFLDLVVYIGANQGKVCILPRNILWLLHVDIYLFF